MKIIALNIWGGRLHDDLISFLKRNSDVDIFCLQEVYHDAVGKDTIWQGANFNSFRDIASALPEYTSVHHPHLEDWWGLALFIKKNIPQLAVGEEYVHLYKGHNLQKEVLGHTAKNIEYVKTELNGKPLWVLNFHGLWNGEGKTDTEARIRQSEKIVAFVQNLEGSVVLCGDFNLLPDTKSIQILEDAGLRNLITEFGITSTRTPLYSKPEQFADYMFVSKDIVVTEFSVLQDIVSDHSPLSIEIA